MAWIVLIIAGLIETGWAVGLKFTDGFTKPLPTVLTLLGILASTALLAIAAKQLPIGTAYTVWVGIGALGAVMLGAALFNEPLSPLRMLFVAILVVAIIGLKLTSQG